MDLDSVKGYLRVDGTDEDALIITMMNAAKSYIASAVGAYDDTNVKAQQLLLAIVQDFYDNRQLMQSEQQMKMRMEAMYASIILQLQLEYEEGEVTASEDEGT